MKTCNATEARVRAQILYNGQLYYCEVVVDDDDDHDNDEKLRPSEYKRNFNINLF